MSTNYYAYGPAIDPEGLHIGQSAAGWRFLFRGHPDLGLTTHAAWQRFLRQPGVRIEDEYGLDIDLDEMDATMTRRRLPDGTPLKPRVTAARTTLPDDWHIDPDGHAFCAKEFC